MSKYKSGKATKHRTPCMSAILAGCVLLGSTAVPAQADQIDCKVILCLVGGFPTGCQDAHSYMIDRITGKPPKPPYGICETVDLNGEQGTYDGALSRMFTQSEPPVCELEYTDYRENAGTQCVLWSTRHNATIDISVERSGDAPPFTNSYIWRTWQTFSRVDPSTGSDSGR